MLVHLITASKRRGWGRGKLKLEYSKVWLRQDTAVEQNSIETQWSNVMEAVKEGPSGPLPKEEYREGRGQLYVGH